MNISSLYYREFFQYIFHSFHNARKGLIFTTFGVEANV